MAFNWQSAAFSLPSLVGYLVPASYAYTVQVIVTLWIAGVGAFVFGRVLGLSVLPAAFAGTVFQLSGSFVGWLGWPHSGVIAWMGWLFAAVLLIVRGRRLLGITMGAASMGFAVLAGQPEILTMLIVSLSVFVGFVLLGTLGVEAIGRSPIRVIGDLLLAGLAGIALGSPLALPGLQLAANSTRNSSTLSVLGIGSALPRTDVIHVIAQGFNGLPVSGSAMFGDPFYIESAAYVGVIAVVLAFVAVAVRRRDAAVLGMAAIVCLSSAAVFLPIGARALAGLPQLGAIDWHRALLPLDFCMAMLGAVGLQILMSGRTAVRTLYWIGAGFVIAACALGTLFVFGNGGLSKKDWAIRAHRLEWPILMSVGSAFIVAMIILVRRRHCGDPTESLQPERKQLPLGKEGAGRLAAALLLGIETVFLVTSGAVLLSSTPSGPPPSPLSQELRATVGDTRVGFGSFTCPAGPGDSSLGILPDANIFYGVRELNAYDPILPKSYFSSWEDASGSPGGIPIFQSFCPAVSSTRLAQEFGVVYVLEPKGQLGPTGSVFQRVVGNEVLYRIQDSGAVTAVPTTAEVTTGPGPLHERVLLLGNPDTSSFNFTESAQSPSTLHIHLSDVPGWSATIDGRSLRLEPYLGTMLQANVPPGRHLISLHYWPALFTVGLIGSGMTVLAFIIAFAIVLVRKRRVRPMLPSAPAEP